MQALKRAQRDAPLMFTGYGIKINEMRARLQLQHERIKALITEQSIELRMMGTDTLRKQQNRLHSYLAQTRFAIAQIHDRASHRKDEDSPGEAEQKDLEQDQPPAQDSGRTEGAK